MLSCNFLTAPIIRPGPSHMFKLRRGKPDLSAFAPLPGKILYPFQSSLTRFKVCLQNRITFRHIIGAGLPVVISGIRVFPVIEMDRISLWHFLVFGDSKLFLSGFLRKIPLKIFRGTNHQGIGQFVCNDRILLTFFRCSIMDAAAPALYLFQIPVLQKETVIDFHGILHGADFRDHALQFPYCLDIFFLPCKTFLRRVVPAVILRGGT